MKAVALFSFSLSSTHMNVNTRRIWLRARPRFFLFFSRSASIVLKCVVLFHMFQTFVLMFLSISISDVNGFCTLGTIWSRDANIMELHAVFPIAWRAFKNDSSLRSFLTRENRSHSSHSIIMHWMQRRREKDYSRTFVSANKQFLFRLVFRIDTMYANGSNMHKHTKHNIFILFVWFF